MNSLDCLFDRNLSQRTIYTSTYYRTFHTPIGGYWHYLPTLIRQDWNKIPLFQSGFGMNNELYLPDSRSVRIRIPLDAYPDTTFTVDADPVPGFSADPDLYQRESPDLYGSIVSLKSSRLFSSWWWSGSGFYELCESMQIRIRIRTTPVQ